MMKDGGFRLHFRFCPHGLVGAPDRGQYRRVVNLEGKKDKNENARPAVAPDGAYRLQW